MPNIYHLKRQDDAHHVSTYRYSPGDVNVDYAGDDLADRVDSPDELNLHMSSDGAVIQNEMGAAWPSFSEDPMPATRSRRKRRRVACVCGDSFSESSSTSSESIDLTLSESGSVIKECCMITNGCLFGLLSVVLILGVAVPCVLGVYALIIVKPGPVIDKSIESFAIPNHMASQRYDALQDAAKSMRGFLYDNFGRKKRSSQNIRLGPDTGDLSWVPLLPRNRRDAYTRGKVIPGVTQGSREWKLELIYIARGDGDNEPNIFTRDHLRDIHEIEQKVRNHKHDGMSFEEFCYVDYANMDKYPGGVKYGACAPFNTLLTYFYPTVIGDQNNGTVYFDSFGHVLYDINTTLSFAMKNPSFFWYVDDQISATNRKSRLLRSEVQFGKPISGYDRYEAMEEQTERFERFLNSYIELLEGASTSRVKVLYGGPQLYDHMIDEIFWGDILLASIAAAFILALMYILTSFSIWLTIWGCLSIVLSFPLALFFYRVIFRTQALGILNGVATFVVIGIGVDDVFVFINTFRQTSSQLPLRSRLRLTVVTAGTSTFFTSSTTSAAFAANIASSIPAVHDFGLFMSVIVMCCWVMVMWIMPPVVAIWQAVFARCEACCYSSCTRCKPPSSGNLPEELGTNTSAATKGPAQTIESSGGQLAVPHSGLHPLDQTSSLGKNLAYDCGSVIYLGFLNQMLSEDERIKVPNPLLVIRNETPQKSNGCDFTKRLQIFSYKYLAWPVIRGRWIILGFYLALLAISAGLASQLIPASKPPQLFRSGSNLQMLLDLAANFSDADIKCDRCSGIYMSEPYKLNQQTEQPREATNPWPVPATNAPPPVPGGGFPGPPGPAPNTPPPPMPTPQPSTLSTTTTTTTTTTTPIPGVPATSTPQKPATNTDPPLTPKQPPALTMSPTPAPTPKPAPTPTPPPNTAPKTQHTSRVETPQPAGPTPTTVPVTTTSIPTLDICQGDDCKNVDERPNLEVGASVYVVFGIKGINRTGLSGQSVLSEKGNVILDDNFAAHFTLESLVGDTKYLSELCHVCKLIANYTKLVDPKGAQCLPEYIFRDSEGIASVLQTVPNCSDIPYNQVYMGRYLPSRAMAGFVPPPGTKQRKSGFLWIAFSFASRTFKGQSYFQAYNDYQDWEDLISDIKKTELDPDSPLQSMFQTSEFWTQVMMEVVAVNSAIYGLLLSLLICISLVTIFTGHVILLVIISLTILGVVMLVVALFWLAGWEVGAVEAVSLSILVGSSVDYCVHLVEGYLQAGKRLPENRLKDPKKARRWRTRSGVSHVGVSILSSAITTIIAAIPLTQTTILPFAKFGEIIAINTTVSIVYTLTACTAFLRLFGPAFYKRSVRSVGIAFASTVAVVGSVVLALFVVARFGYHIPGPDGEDLFPVPDKPLTVSIG